MWRSPIGISKLVGKARIVFLPVLNARPGDIKRWLGPEWFIVVAEAEEDMGGRNQFAPLAQNSFGAEATGTTAFTLTREPSDVAVKLTE